MGTQHQFNITSPFFLDGLWVLIGHSPKKIVDDNRAIQSSFLLQKTD